MDGPANQELTINQGSHLKEITYVFTVAPQIGLDEWIRSCTWKSNKKMLCKWARYGHKPDKPTVIINVIVIAQCQGCMAVNRGVWGHSQRKRFVYYSHKSLAIIIIYPIWLVIINTSVHVQVFTVTSILFTVTVKWCKICTIVWQCSRL